MLRVRGLIRRLPWYSEAPTTLAKWPRSLRSTEASAAERQDARAGKGCCSVFQRAAARPRGVGTR